MSKSAGDMYPWITKTWTPIGGACPINCPYCYVKAMSKRFPAIAAKYAGEPRLVGPWPKFKKGDVVFVCHMTDLFAMPPEIVASVLNHCGKYPDATYVLQTKEPQKVYEYAAIIPTQTVIGTTIETDVLASSVLCDRIYAMRRMRDLTYTTFITIEPIQRFSEDFASTIVGATPSFVNIGADSKSSGLPEPTSNSVQRLIVALRDADIEVRLKSNLKRILRENAQHHAEVRRPIA